MPALPQLKKSEYPSDPLVLLCWWISLAWLVLCFQNLCPGQIVFCIPHPSVFVLYWILGCCWSVDYNTLLIRKVVFPFDSAPNSDELNFNAYVLKLLDCWVFFSYFAGNCGREAMRYLLQLGKHRSSAWFDCQIHVSLRGFAWIFVLCSYEKPWFFENIVFIIFYFIKDW